MARVFHGITALLFIGSAVVTIGWCGSMAQMPGMEMPGGWSMSMTWMRMPGQSWSGAAASFLGMWAVMMVAMMLPAMAPVLRDQPPATAARVASAYFAVWLFVGAVIYPLGVALATLEMHLAALARIVPSLAAAALCGAGLLQLSAWKARQLDSCRSLRHGTTATPAVAWRRGISLALRCCACCAPLTAALLVVGVMDLRAMAAATVAISLERLAPRGAAFARLCGALLLGAGLTIFVVVQLG